MLTSSLTLSTSYPYYNEDVSVRKQVYIYEATSYLLLPIFRYLSIATEVPEIKRTDMMEGGVTPATEHSGKDVSQGRTTKKKWLGLVNPLAISTVLGLIMFAIPSDSKQNDMPYFINQTFVYLQNLSISM